MYKEYLKKILLSEKGNPVNIKEKTRILEKRDIIRWAHGYPDEYKFGISCIGFQMIYFLLNEDKDTFCERFFLLEKKNGVLTLETQTPLNKFEIISFTLHYEPLYPNFLKILEKSKIPIFSSERERPILIGGGISASINPEPLSQFFDAFIIGEAEETIKKILEVYKKNRRKRKKEILREFAKIDGVYVPSFYRIKYLRNGEIRAIASERGAPKKVEKQCMEDINYFQHFIVSPFSVDPNLCMIEIARGCNRGCRFCMLGHFFRPERFRKKEIIIKIAKNLRKYTNKIRLVAPSVDEHPEIIEILKELKSMGYKIKVGSQRADLLSNEFLELIDNDFFTIAPETSLKLRYRIKKMISDVQIFEAIEMLKKNKISELQLFLIIGFPFETKKDIEELIELIKKIRKKLDVNTRLILNINCHIKRPFTPFQWEKQLSYGEYMKKIDFINKNLGKLPNTKIETMRRKQLIIEDILVRGDRIAGKILYDAYRFGNNVNAWYKALKLNKRNLRFYLRKRKFNEILPWDLIVNPNISKKQLMSEYEKAKGINYTIF
jgi:radical SAM superfamily enzyme YgiQ (UPF0313 family)